MDIQTTSDPHLLADLSWCLAQAPAGQAGALWRLAESPRQLDANLIRLAPLAQVESHTEGDLDVLLLVVEGSGALRTDHDVVALAEQSLIWLPRGSRRSLIAGPNGLAYVTVHQKRPGMGIRSGPPTGGE
jgi:quercetin dioxygenase-like cupin family protein